MHDRIFYIIYKGNMHIGTDVPLSPQAESENACGLDSQQDPDK